MNPAHTSFDPRHASLLQRLTRAAWGMRRLATVGLVLILAFSMFLSALADPGDLDPTFSTDGWLRQSLSSDDDNGRALVLQNDGKIVVAGYSETAPGVEDIAIARFNDDGTLDTTYSSGDGTDGWTFTDIAAPGNDEALAAVYQPDGKTVVAGWSLSQIALARYCLNGQLDDGLNCGAPGFGSGGIVTTNLPGTGQDRISTLLRQPDGKLVVGGLVRYAPGVVGNPPNYNFMLARYCPDGMLDNGVNCGGSGFGTGGVFLVASSAPQLDLHTDEQVTAIALQPDGSIVAAGYSLATVDVVVFRVTSAGVLDTTFGGGAGWVVQDRGATDRAEAMAIQKDGKILVAGTTGLSTASNFAIGRFLPNGDPDPSFNADGNADGFLTTDIAGEQDWVQAMTIQADGKILVAGETNFGGGREFGMARYMAEDGALDPTFANGGVLFTLLTDGPDSAFAMALTPRHGKIVLAGRSQPFGAGTFFDFALARYLNAIVSSNTLNPGETLAFGATDLTITLSSGGPCTITVEKYPVPPGGGQPGVGELPVYWDITSDCAPGTYNLNLVFDYTDVEVLYGNAVMEDNLGGYRSVDGGVHWISQDGSTPNAAANTVTVSGVTAVEGEWGLASAAPTAVTMAGFQAAASHQRVDVAWITVSEGGLQGFHLYRSESLDGERTRLTANLWTAENVGGVGNWTYQFSDTTYTPGHTYYYWLELLDTAGGSQWLEAPTIAQTWSDYNYMPLVRQ